MKTAKIIDEIKKLSVDKRIVIMEQTLKSIRDSAGKKQLRDAVEALGDDYSNDKELIAFTSIDFDDFYETR